MTKKFEAVSGDQGLFDLVGALDCEHFIVVKSGRALIPVIQPIVSSDKVIAERKPIEKYVPKVGDDYIVSTRSGIFRCVFIDNIGNVYGTKEGWLHTHREDWMNNNNAVFIPR